MTEERYVPEMTEEQKRILRIRMRELEARTNAYFHILENPIPNDEVQQQVLDELRYLREEAQGQVAYLKREYGFRPY